MSWKFIILLGLLLVVLAFAVQNYEVIEIRFLAWAFETSRAIVIFATLLVGILIGWILSLRSR